MTRNRARSIVIIREDGIEVIPVREAPKAPRGMNKWGYRHGVADAAKGTATRWPLDREVDQYALPYAKAYRYGYATETFRAADRERLGVEDLEPAAQRFAAELHAGLVEAAAAVHP